MQEHGGVLSVESEVGQWTRFCIDLPVQETRNAERGARKAEGGRGNAEGGRNFELRSDRVNNPQSGNP